MLYKDLFGPWGPVVLTVIGAVSFLLLLLLFACFFTPGCIGYECLRRRKNLRAPLRPRSDDNGKLGDVSYRSWRLGSLYENGSNGTISENTEFHGDHSNANNVHLGTVDGSSTLNLVQMEKQKCAKTSREFPTELTMSLQYFPPCKDVNTGKLVIGIEALNNLPPKQYNCALEPYVALNIMKESWSHRKRQKLHSFRTRAVRHTACPVFRETFIVADAPREVKEWVVDISACDLDRYANHTELCFLRVPLKEVKKIFQSPEIHMFNFDMKPSCQEFGNILLGVSYLPTAQRLSINIIKLRDIKFTPAVRSLQEFNPYIRILMLNGRTGKKIKKKKTKFFQGTAQPEFNETLTFDLYNNQIDNLQFLIILCSKVTLEEMPATITEVHSDSEDSFPSFKRSNDIRIGKVALGRGVRGKTERAHWFSVLQNPRKLVTIWHTFK